MAQARITRRRTLLAIVLALAGLSWWLLHPRTDSRLVGTWTEHRPGWPWQSFITLNADGSGELRVERDGELVIPREPIRWSYTGETIVVTEPGLSACLPTSTLEWLGDHTPIVVPRLRQRLHVD